MTEGCNDRGSCLKHFQIQATFSIETASLSILTGSSGSGATRCVSDLITSPTRSGVLILAMSRQSELAIHFLKFTTVSISGITLSVIYFLLGT